MTAVLSIDPRTGRAFDQVAQETTPDAVLAACEAAAAAGITLERLDRQGRARMLRSMADALDEDRDALVEVADGETALGPARLGAELTRTCFQLRLFAEVLEEGSYLEATVDPSGPTAMGPRPDLRRMLRPLGPVAVFGASNFPFAFSIPGGDTASALAAGCPVVAKAHDAHPRTSLRAHRALLAGAAAAGAPDSTVQLVWGQQAGAAIVQHPRITAVGFTGSLGVGRMLHDIAATRPAPIPFYGELGALNALVVAPVAATERGEAIAEGLATSFTLGVGQFCTKPGLALVPAGEVGAALVGALTERVTAMRPGVLLSSRTLRGFVDGREALRALPGVRVLAAAPDPEDGAGFGASPVLLEAAASRLEGPLLEECFGPVLVLARYRDQDELLATLEALPAALTLSVHAAEADGDLARSVLELAQRRTGRVVWGGFPTGVAVSWAMQHGGPWPATTNALHTSVGAASIRRWLRPVCYQDVPDEFLPVELRSGPALVPRRVAGRLELPGDPAPTGDVRASS